MKLTGIEEERVEQKVEGDLNWAAPVSIYPKKNPMLIEPITAKFVSPQQVSIEGDVLTQFNAASANTADRILGSKKQAVYQFNSLLLLTWVLLLHLIAIFLINQFWTRAVPTFNNISPVKIDSYLYQAPQRAPKLVTHSDLEAGSKLANGSVFTESPTKEVQLKQVSNVTEQPVKEQPQKELASDTKTQQPLSRSAASKTRVSVRRFTQSYLEKQRTSQLDNLVLSSANQYTQKRSLSELDGEMEELIFPDVDKYSKVSVTGHNLDPNRIVRQGDTCYRIVKVPTQLNPYAENIGYPFNCGGDKVKKALNDAISARLEKLILPIKN